MAPNDKGRRPDRWRPTSEMMMSDEPFLPPPVPLMSAVKARNLARSCKAMANYLREQAGDNGTARLLDQQSAWWMAYSITLSQTPPGRIDDEWRAP